MLKGFGKRWTSYDLNFNHSYFVRLVLPSFTDPSVVMQIDNTI